MAETIVYSENFSGGTIPAEFTGVTRGQINTGTGPSGENCFAWDGTGTPGLHAETTGAWVKPSGAATEGFDQSLGLYWFLRWKLKVSAAALAYIDSVTIPAVGAIQSLAQLSGSPTQASFFGYDTLKLVTEHVTLTGNPAGVPSAGAVALPLTITEGDHSGIVYRQNGAEYTRASFDDTWHDMEIRWKVSSHTPKVGGAYQNPPNDGWLTVFVDGSTLHDVQGVGIAFEPDDTALVYRLNAFTIGAPGEITNVELGYVTEEEETEEPGTVGKCCVTATTPGGGVTDPDGTPEPVGPRDNTTIGPFVYTPTICGGFLAAATDPTDPQDLT